jgi:hypothetical protein
VPAQVPTSFATGVIRSEETDRKVPLMPGGSAVPGAGAAGEPVYADKENLKHQCFYFADADVGPDTWTSGIRGIVSLAWTVETGGSVSAVLTTAATGVITLVASAGNCTGWLHVWSRN